MTSSIIYNHIIIFNADACLGQNPSILSTKEACLNQINWTCDNEWHYLITILINVISQSTNWTVQKRNWHQKLHPLPIRNAMCQFWAMRELMEIVWLLKQKMKIWKTGISISPDVSGPSIGKKTTVFRNKLEFRHVQSACVLWFKSKIWEKAAMFPYQTR